jgi:hypothetical protein
MQELPISSLVTKLVLALKLKHEHLFYINRKGIELLFRPLTLKEFNSFSSLTGKIPTTFLEDKIIETGILYITGGIDKFLDESPAGYPSTIANTIMKYSGYGKIEYIDNQIGLELEKADSLENVLGYTIYKILQIPFKEIQNMSLYTQAKYLALCQNIKNNEDPQKNSNSLLSKENADIPNPNKERRQQQRFLTGKEILDHGITQ